jgi:hypothetical protein
MLARERDNISSRSERAIEITPGPARTTGQRREGEEKRNIMLGIRSTTTTVKMFPTPTKTIHQSRY